MTAGRLLVVGIGVVTLLFAGVLWYYQTRAFYRTVEAGSVEIAGTAYPVTAYRGIDAETSPLKMRACFRLDGPVAGPLAPAPTPLVAPGWFDCFDAGQLTRDLAAGQAAAYLAVENIRFGFDQIVARYPDGRAYLWRQINPCGEALYAGFPLPDGCPPPPDA